MINSLAKRTFSPQSNAFSQSIERIMMYLDKVLSDERSSAYATDIQEINRLLLDCKECNWYKSKQMILSEVRLSIQIILF